LHSVFLQSLYNSFINRNQVLLYFSISGNFHEYFIVISLLSFHSEHNPDQWYQSRLLLIIFQRMSPTRSEYSQLGLEFFSLEDNHSRTPKKPSMAAEKKDDGAEDSINLLLEQALARQRDEMMENFAHILQCLSIATCTSSSSDHFGGTSPFKVQVNFDIPIFEGQIDADALEKWLNLLEGYFSVQKNFRQGKYHLRTPQGSPPCQTLVGNLLGEKFHRGIWNIWGRAHLGFFCGCGQRTILSC
jgi:hypothetical protein